MIIGIVGSRRRDSDKDYDLVEKAFLILYKNGDSIVSGECYKGGDRFAEIIAKKLNIPIKIYPADWNEYGKGAGFIRNTYIARDSDVLIACVAKDRTGGTEDTVKKYLKLNKKELVLI